MKDFQLRNDTKLLFRDDPVDDLKGLFAGKRVLFVYGGGSACENGCRDDVAGAAREAAEAYFELPGASRELSDVERGIEAVRENGIDLVIGAGGASIMDCAKLIAFGSRHEDDLWEYVKARKDPYGLDKLGLALMPTYPSSGSEYGLGAVCADSRTGDFGTAYGIAADVAILCPKYSLTLGAEMTVYTGLVTLVQLCASTLGDRNPVSYGIGISVIRNVIGAARRLREDPSDLDARGTVMYGASISTSGRLGLGKEGNWPYDIYEVEFVPEVLFGAKYRESLTALFPRFLAVVGRAHADEVRGFVRDAFDIEAEPEAAAERIVELFEELGAPMRFKGKASADAVRAVDVSPSELTADEVVEIVQSCTCEG